MKFYCTWTVTYRQQQPSQGTFNISCTDLAMISVVLNNMYDSLDLLTMAKTTLSTWKVSER